MSKLVRLSFFLGLLILVNQLHAERKVVNVCTVVWPPYTTTSGNGVDGTHTKKVKEVIEALGYKPVIKEIPWKRCLGMAKRGKIDFVYSASFNEKRAKYLEYPKEPLEVLSYVVVTLKKDNQPQWEGDYKKIALPVGVPLGFSVATKLRDNGLKVDEGAVDDFQNFDKLLKGRVKSIVVEKTVLASCLKKKNATNLVVVHDTPFKKNKAYFLTTSKKFENAPQVAAKISEVLKGEGA